MSQETDLIKRVKEGRVLMKLKYSFMMLIAAIIMLMTTSIEGQAAEENQIAQIKSETAKIYKKASKKSASVVVKSGDMDYSFYVRQSKKVDNTTYYLLEKGSKTMGWLDKKDLQLKKRTLIDQKKKDLYIMESGYASTMPAATARNQSYDLNKIRGAKIAVERYEKVGKDYWYKGKIAGRKNIRWIRAEYVTTNAYVGVNLRKPSNVTTAELRALLLLKGKTPDNIMYQLAPEFIKAQKSTGVSAQFMFAHAALETGWGSSVIAAYKKNLFGYQAYDSCPVTCSKYFPTGEDGLKLYASKIVNNYLVTTGAYYNGMNVLDMNVRYASDKTWGQKIANIMNQIKPYNAAYYVKEQPSSKKVAASTDFGSEIPAGQATPSAFVAMPAKITAKVSSDTAIVYSIPYTYAPRIGSYNKGKSVTIKAYHSDVKEFTNNKGGKSRWYRITYAGKQGWVRSDQVKTTNLSFTTVDATLRQNAGTKYEKVGNAVKNTPLKLVLKSSKPVTKKDSAKKVWYQAYNPTAPTKKIWIRSDLVQIFN